MRESGEVREIGEVEVCSKEGIAVSDGGSEALGDVTRKTGRVSSVSEQSAGVSVASGWKTLTRSSERKHMVPVEGGKKERRLEAAAATEDSSDSEASMSECIELSLTGTNTRRSCKPRKGILLSKNDKMLSTKNKRSQKP